MLTRTPLALRQLRLVWRGLAVLCLLFLLFRAGRARNGRVERLDVRATPELWAQSGFVEMVPPLRLPGRASPELETHVWLRLPARGALRVTREPGTGRPLLHYPEGTEAVRVEVSGATALADARGIRFLAREAQRFFVLRPKSEPTALGGWAWPRGDDAAQTEATRLLGEVARGNAPARQAEAAARLTRAQNACAHCHELARADATHEGQFGEVARGTDGAGLFQIQTVLADHVPLESYAPRERNSSDPNIEVRCGAALAPGHDTKFGLVFACPERLVPIGYLNVSRGVEMGDARVLALCRARRYLFEHLDSAGRIAFADAFRACGISGSRAHAGSVTDCDAATY